MTDIEIWKDIDGYQGAYQISNHGRVRSLNRVVGNKSVKGQMMKILPHTNGYMVIYLRSSNGKKKFFIHRLVAYSFLDKGEDHIQVNHKDKDRQHNHVRNLEWCTWEENYKHRDGVCNDEPF